MMPVLIISDPKTGTSQKVELEDAMMNPFIGRRIGDIMEGTIATMAGYQIKLTGGTDKDGIPMRPDVHGGVKGRYILSGGVGYKPKKKGERKRVVVRGNTVTAETTFLNFTIVEKPEDAKKPEKPKEEPAEE